MATKDKKWLISATFPGVDAAHAEQHVTVVAKQPHVATVKGLRELLKRDHIKGKPRARREFRLHVELLGEVE